MDRLPKNGGKSVFGGSDCYAGGAKLAGGFDFTKDMPMDSGSRIGKANRYYKLNVNTRSSRVSEMLRVLLLLTFVSSKADAFDGICAPPELDGDVVFNTSYREYVGEIFAAQLLVEAKDLDADGVEDLIVMGTQPPSAKVWDGKPFMGKILYNRGPRGFEEATGEHIYTVNPTEVLYADFDQNGLVDFFIADAGDNGSPSYGAPNRLMLQFQTGWVEESWRLDFDLTGKTVSASTYDVDTDGDTDVFVFNNDPSGENNLKYWLINDGRGHFSVDGYFLGAPPAYRLPESIGFGQGFNETWDSDAVLTADFDADGHVDLLLGGSSKNDMASRIYWGDADGWSDERQTSLSLRAPFDAMRADAIRVRSLSVGDINADGSPDIYLVGMDSSAKKSFIQLWLNGGSRLFIDQTNQRFGNSTSPVAGNPAGNYRWIDFNGDQIPDIVPERFQHNEDSIFAWLGDGNGFFSAVVSDGPSTSATLESERIGTYAYGGATPTAFDFVGLSDELVSVNVSAIAPSLGKTFRCPLGIQPPIIPRIKPELVEELLKN